MYIVSAAMCLIKKPVRRKDAKGIECWVLEGYCKRYAQTDFVKLKYYFDFKPLQECQEKQWFNIVFEPSITTQSKTEPQNSKPDNPVHNTNTSGTLLHVSWIPSNFKKQETPVQEHNQDNESETLSF